MKNTDNFSFYMIFLKHALCNCYIVLLTCVCVMYCVTCTTRCCTV